MIIIDWIKQNPVGAFQWAVIALAVLGGVGVAIVLIRDARYRKSLSPEDREWHDLLNDLEDPDVGQLIAAAHTLKALTPSQSAEMEKLVDAAMTDDEKGEAVSAFIAKVQAASK